MLQPLQDLEAIEDRLNGVSFFLRPENLEHTLQLKSYLKCVRDVTKILTRIRTFRASVIDWWHLFQVQYVHIASWFTRNFDTFSHGI
jgi:DNA mismatch repair ATPase MutS